MRIKIIEAGCDGKKRTRCSHCKKYVKKDERNDTCTNCEYIMLCDECYKKAGSSVR